MQIVIFSQVRFGYKWCHDVSIIDIHPIRIIEIQL
jgi:hypothetical protein